MRVRDRRPAGRQQRVHSDRDTPAHDHDVAISGGDLNDLADEAVRDRVARGGEPNPREPIDLALLTAGDRGSRRRQRPKQRPLDLQALRWTRSGLVVDLGVDLPTPRRARLVGVQPPEALIRDQVGLREPNQRLDLALALRVLALGRARREAIVRREAHELRIEHRDTREVTRRDGLGVIEQHPPRNAADLLEAVRQPDR